MTKSNLLLTIQYDPIGQILALTFWLFSCLVLGIGFIILGMTKILLMIVGIIFVVFSLIRFIDILLFKKMEIYDDYLIKTFGVFGSYKLAVPSLKTSKGNGIFGGTLVFWKDGLRLKYVLFFGLDLLAVNRKSIAEIKKVLITLNVIKGDENDWID